MTDQHPTAPSPEEYSRVTNPGRFATLHTRAVDLLTQLSREYDVDWTDVFELPPDVQPFDHARSPITLTPVRSTAAPIAVGFTSFPSLVVRCGRWVNASFPACGCDACRETADGEGERFQQLVQDVVAGQFREQLVVPYFRAARLRWWLGNWRGLPHRFSGGSRAIPKASARALRRGNSRDVSWQPWPRRP
jgi:hypothetical protein